MSVNVNDVIKAYGLRTMRTRVVEPLPQVVATSIRKRQDILNEANELSIQQKGRPLNENERADINRQIGDARERERLQAEFDRDPPGILNANPLGIRSAAYRIAGKPRQLQEIESLVSFEDIEDSFQKWRIRNQTTMNFDVSNKVIKQLQESGAFDRPENIRRLTGVPGFIADATEAVTGDAISETARLFTTAVVTLNDSIVNEGTADLADLFGLNPDTWGDVIRSGKIGEIDHSTDITKSLLGVDFIDDSIKQTLQVDAYSAARGKFEVGAVGSVGTRREREGDVRFALDAFYGFLGFVDVAAVGKSVGKLAFPVKNPLFRKNTAVRPGVAADPEGFTLVLNPNLLGDTVYTAKRAAAMEGFAQSKSHTEISNALRQGRVADIVPPQRLRVMVNQIAKLDNPNIIDKYINDVVSQEMRRLTPGQIERNRLYQRDLSSLTEGKYGGAIDTSSTLYQGLVGSKLRILALDEANVPTVLRHIIMSADGAFRTRGEFLQYVKKVGFHEFFRYFDDHRFFYNSKSTPMYNLASKLDYESSIAQAEIMATLLSRPVVIARELDQISKGGGDVAAFAKRLLRRGSLGMSGGELRILDRNIETVRKLKERRDELLNSAMDGDRELRNSFYNATQNLGSTADEQLNKLWDVVEDARNINDKIPTVDDAGINTSLKRRRTQELTAKIPGLDGTEKDILTEVAQNRLIGLRNQMRATMDKLGIEVPPDEMNYYAQAKALPSIIAAESEIAQRFNDNIATKLEKLLNDFNKSGSSATQAAQATGTAARAGRKIGGDEFREDFNNYLWYSTAAGFNNIHGKGAAGITSGEASQRLSELTNKYGEGYFDEVAGDVYEFNRESLAYNRDAGLISEDDYINILRSREKYVPLQRDLEDGSEFLRSQYGDAYGAPVPRTVRTARGSEREVVDPLGASVRNRLVAIAAKQTNEVGKRLERSINELEEARVFGNETPLIQIVSEKADDTIEFIVDGRRRYYRVNDPASLRALQSLLPYQANGLVLWGANLTKMMSLSFTGASPAFYVPNYGRDTVYMMANMSADRGLRQALQSFARVTPLGSSFRGLVAERAEQSGVPLLGSIASREVKDEARVFRATGGNIGGNVADIRRQNAKVINEEINKVLDLKIGNFRAKTWARAQRGIKNLFFGVSNIFEGVNRFEANRVGRAVGGTAEQAREMSHFITINFLERGSGLAGRTIPGITIGARIPGTQRRVGISTRDRTVPEGIRGLGSNYAFLNARIQSVPRFSATLFGGRGRGVLTALLISGALAEAEYELNSDIIGKIPGYDWYEELRQATPFKLNRYFQFGLDPEEESYLSIPMPYDFGPFMKLARIGTRLRHGDIEDSEALNEMAEVPLILAGLLNPLAEGTLLHKIAPTPFQPAISSGLNINWHGGMVSPKDIGRFSLPEDTIWTSQLADNRTEWEVAKALSGVVKGIPIIGDGLFEIKGTPTTPGRAQTFLDSYGGGILDAAAGLVDTVRQAAGEDIIRSDTADKNPAIFYNVFARSFFTKRPSVARIQRAQVNKTYNDTIIPAGQLIREGQRDGDNEKIIEGLDVLIDIKRDYDKGIVPEDGIDPNKFMSTLMSVDGWSDLNGIFLRSATNIQYPRVEYDPDGSIKSTPSFEDFYIYYRLSQYIVDKDIARRQAGNDAEAMQVYLNAANGTNTPPSF